MQPDMIHTWDMSQSNFSTLVLFEWSTQTSMKGISAVIP